MQEVLWRHTQQKTYLNIEKLSLFLFYYSQILTLNIRNMTLGILK